MREPCITSVITGIGYACTAVAECAHKHEIISTQIIPTLPALRTYVIPDEFCPHQGYSLEGLYKEENTTSLLYTVEK